MTFQEMDSDHRAAVLAWARSHDWGVNARWSAEAPVAVLTGCECVVTHEGGGRAIERASFADLSDLRAWAGY